MTTEQYFNCIFCKETFDNKEELQIHFRKHGDPKFNQNMKNRSRPQSESPNTSDKLTEENELVGCDVCEEVFPTISKAITHKHKMHPDHDAKYFCPFCGKLFTMKHLYNKHIQANHDTNKVLEKSDFQCECCDVLFYVPSAMMYHNKFFHRQDTEIPSIGQSKKVKLYFQELLQIYYCSFCGEEFNNKVNLHKHIGDDHSDENQTPDDVLKCPLCEALFYHLDAYEVHLMFHSPDDIYSEKNQMVDEITEFSLETVPPIVEKIEDEDTTHNIPQLDDFLQLVMGGDSVANDELGKVKLKKHKKHKKSKKAAITLDEFLNMNKDVFGDGIDVHGIEEVPTQVVLKKYKGRKPTNAKSKAINVDIDKLKKQGIVVKSKKKPIATKAKKMLENNESLGSPNQEVNPHSIAAPGDVLSKLLRQSSTQIKIVKKSIPQNENMQLEEQNSENTKLETNNQNKTNMAKENSSEIKCDSVDDKLGKSDEEDDMDTSDEVFSKQSEDGNFNNSLEHSNIPAYIAESEINKDEDSIFNNKEENELDNKGILEDMPKSDMRSEDVDNVTKENNDGENNSTETISALKRLSHLITIKPVKQNQYYPTEKNDRKIKEENSNSGDSSSEDNYENKSQGSIFKAPEVLPKKNCHQNIKKTINTATITKTCNMVKMGALSNKESSLEFQDEENSKPNIKSQTSEDGEKVTQKTATINSGLLSRLTNVTAKSISSKSTTPALQVDAKVNVPQTLNKKGVIDENIEIFNIDDSDSEDAGDESSNETTKCDVLNDERKNQNTSVKNFIPNLNKNITIKACQQKPIISDLNKSSKEKDQINVGKDSSYTKVKMHSSEIQKSVNLQNTLKNLSSNITVKTKNSSFIPNKEQDIHDGSDCYDSDEELDDGKVKITEVTEDVNDMEYESNDDSNMFVQSPDETNVESDSNINNDDDDDDDDGDHVDNDDYKNNHDEYDDIESQIKSTTVKKSSQPKSPYLDNFKNCGNELTIKPLNEKMNSAEDLAKSPNKKEIYNRPKAANKNNQQTHSNEICTMNQNILNKKTSTASNEVNTVKTVKKFQTQTVIQEVTTVTRTIRTVNESTNEVVQNTQTSKPQNTNKNPSAKDYYGKVVRHVTPTVGTRVMNVGNIATVRPSNQMVSMRPSLQTIRAIGPATKPIRKPTPIGNTQKPIIGKLKISPNIINQTKSPQKRPSNIIPNNNLKKPKVSNALVETSGFNNDDASMEYTTASTSQSNFSSTTKIVQGKSTIMTSQTRSEVTNMQQQLNKLSGMSGLKVMKTSTKQAMQVEEKSECVTPKSNTLEAIEKLQKIGLLVKKPQAEFDDDEEHQFGESDDEQYEQ